MVGFMQRIERCAACGAEGLAPEGRAAVTAALLASRRADGGFAGLDGRTDPYFSFFAWLCLRALGADFDKNGLCAFFSAAARGARGVDARCAEIALLREGRRSRCGSWLRFVAALGGRGGTDGYAPFLSLLWLEALQPSGTPRGLARLAWRRFAAGRRRLENLPTPVLAAGMVLAARAGVPDEAWEHALADRRCARGGYASAAGAAPDLLATAVARFARAVRADAEPDRERADDLAFIEACWMGDGLFGPSAAATHGDAEHTFYGLLSLGTCRAAQSDFSQRL